MSFLAPLFLLGVLAVALPLWFHRIRQSTKERQSFSTLLFLETTPPRFTQRSRLQHLLLLALRAAALILLALAFARPFRNTPTPPPVVQSQPQSTVLLLDASASMRRDNLWNEALARVEHWLRQLAPGDAFSLVVFDDTVRPVVRFPEWTAMDVSTRVDECRQRLRTLEPGWGATHLDRGLIQAAESLAELNLDPAANRRIVLITDLQDGSHRQQLQGFSWPQGIHVRVDPVRPRESGNAGLQQIRPIQNLDPTETVVPVRIVNSADARAEEFRLQWESVPGVPPLAVHVPAGSSRSLSLAWPSSNSVTGELVLTGDAAAFDNRLFLARSEPMRRTVRCLTTENPEDPTGSFYFLRRAFAPTSERHVTLETGMPPAEPPGTRSRHLLVAVQPLSAAEITGLRAHVEEGGLALVVLVPGDKGEGVGRLFGRSEPWVEEGKVPVAGYRLLGEVDFEHPVFAPFADARYNDFTKIHFWKFRSVPADALPGTRIVARFDNGDPALLEVPLGRGSVFVLASSWRPEDSELARSTKFVPLLHSLLEQAAGPTVQETLLRVADEWSLPQESVEVPNRIRRPDGQEVVLATNTTRYGPLEVPGSYLAYSGAGGRAFAVNLDPAESRTTPLLPEELAQLGVPLVAPKTSTDVSPAKRTSLHRTELESRQKLWRGFLVAVALLILAETWLAAALTRRSTREAQG